MGSRAKRANEVLLVSMGNLGWSAIAETFLRHRLTELRSNVVVHSVDLDGEGQRLDPKVVKLLRRRGFRLRGYRSTALSPERLAEADLVLVMAAAHRRAVVQMVPARGRYVFTLREVIRWMDAIGGLRPEEAFGAWLGRADAGRTSAVVTALSSADDISDPAGGSSADYRHMAEEVGALTDRLADLLAAAADVAVPDGSADRPRADPGSQNPPRFSPAEGRPDVNLTPGQTMDDTGATAPTNGFVPEPGTEVDGKEISADSNAPPLSLSTDPPVDALRTAHEALQAARETVAETALELSEALRAARAHSALPADAYTTLGDEVATVMRSAAAESSRIREEAERYARGVRAEADSLRAAAEAVCAEAEAESTAVQERADASAATVRGQAEIYAATIVTEAQANADELGRSATAETTALRQDADEYSSSTRGEADAAAALTLARAEAVARRVVAAAREEAEVVLERGNEEAAALMAPAVAERERAIAEAADLRRSTITETAELRDEADKYANSTRERADCDALGIRDEANRHAANLLSIAEVQSTEVRDKATHDAAAMLRSAEDDARRMTSEAEYEATELVRKAHARHLELVEAEKELRRRLEGAAGALVGVLNVPMEAMPDSPAPSPHDHGPSEP